MELYLEGLDFRSIGRILKFSHVAIYKWIREFGEKVEELRSDKQVEVVEIDEMHSYVGDKKNTAGYGWLLIEIGVSSLTALLANETRIGKKLWKKLKNISRDDRL